MCRKSEFSGWQRQAESSKLGDGGFPVRTTIAKSLSLDERGLRMRRTIVKARGLGDATHDSNDFAFALLRAA
jgi:hypothetical protein